VVRVAIVGAGPAGFYAAERLLTAEGVEAQVEMFDRLITPWGLVRAGVAPDHPKIKSVTRVYERTAARHGFRYHGGVEVGRDVTHQELLAHHHAVIYAYGASRDRRLGIAGEDLPGSHAATDFVAWYNGHPDAADLSFDLTARRAVVVGNGNVALDVARMLVLDPDELATTDVADHALEALRASAVEEVVVLGRRGPAQAAYTLPELRELGELRGVDVVVEGETTIPDGLEGPALRAAEVVDGYARRAPTGAPRRIVLRFLASPQEILGEDRARAMRIARNELVDVDGAATARATDEVEELECGLVLRSIGYRGHPIDGLPFDEHAGTVANDRGRVVPGVYTAGWLKRGPSGVIGTNKKCAHETVDRVLEDLGAGLLPEPVDDADALDALLAARGVRRVDYAGWERIDHHERRTGEPVGRPRVKVVRNDELLAHGEGTVATGAGA
jgi:ferredoxin--NADP+ reductase